MKLNKYHQPIADRIPEMTNEELFEEFLSQYLGDGEDGYYSDSCLKLGDILRKELDKRLTESSHHTNRKKMKTYQGLTPQERAKELFEEFPIYDWDEIRAMSRTMPKQLNTAKKLSMRFERLVIGLMKNVIIGEMYVKSLTSLTPPLTIKEMSNTNKIQAEELRIGNYTILKNGLIVKIKCLMSNIAIIQHQDYEPNPHPYEDILGVSLSNEILSKCSQLKSSREIGFEEVYNIYHFELGGNKYRIRESKTGCRLYMGQLFPIQVTWLHEFQNWYYLLSGGTELEIKL